MTKKECKVFTEECYNHPECMATLDSQKPADWEEENIRYQITPEYKAFLNWFNNKRKPNDKENYWNFICSLLKSERERIVEGLPKEKKIDKAVESLREPHKSFTIITRQGFNACLEQIKKNLLK